MKREAERQLQRLAPALSPRQQTLDFDEARRWEQLPAADQQACRSAIAALLYQVTIMLQENDSDER
jgi:hypothetical protein